MKAVSMLAGFGLVGLLVLPADAQKRQLDRRLPPDVSLSGVGGGSSSTIGFTVRLSCVQRIVDQVSGGCLQASSMPTNGMLFPYPGINNTFAGPAYVGGGENNQAAGTWSTVAGGYNNLADEQGVFAGPAFVGGGEGNQATRAWSAIVGGYNNTASQPGSFVGGGLDNVASGAGFEPGAATVGGGRNNVASGRAATVGGGRSNQATGYTDTVAGGENNVASGNAASIGGGYQNTASYAAATVSGGTQNTASGSRSIVSGGARNTASAHWSMIPGGLLNTAAGEFSFAAGREAMANHNGSFVWGDGQTGIGVATKASSTADEFNVYASGGTRFFSNSAATTGVLLAPGGGSWTAVSDRAAKDNVEPVDAQAILDAVVAMPVTTWNYKAQPESIRHMGPMAQDFYAAFGLGLGETTIDTIDPDGVALAAIQGVNQKLEEEIADVRAENVELRKRLERLETILSEPKQGL